MTFKKFFAVVMAALLVTLPLAGLAQSVNVPGLLVAPFKAKYVSDNITAVSTDVGIYVKYVGSEAGAATVEVAAATGDLTFIANGVADDSFECPVSGALGGIIDVSDTACDTLGEVVDVINSSTDRSWIAVISAGLRADSSNNTLDTLAATTAKGPSGVGLLKDTVVALNITNVLLPGGGRLVAGNQAQLPGGIENWQSNPQKVTPHPFADRDTVMLYASANDTYTGAAGPYIVHCVYEHYKAGGVGSSELVITLYQEAMAATTVTGKIDEFQTAGGLSCTGGKMLVRTSAATTLTAPTHVVTGYVKARNP